MSSLLNLRNIVIAVLVLIVAGLAIGCSYTVNDRERAVMLHNGKVEGVADGGLHFKFPVVDSVVFVSTQNRSLLFSGMQAYSQDKQIATLKVSVSYHVPATDIKDVYLKYTSLEGLETNLIARKVPKIVKDVFGGYTAAEVINSRAKFGDQVDKAIVAEIDGPLVIDSIQVENIDFTKEYEESISALLNQQNDTERKKAVNAAAVNTAQAQADSQLLIATANAKAIRLNGEADAYAIKVKADALAANSNLVDLTKAEKWDGKLPTTMVPGSTVPFINIK